jgi:hypothetical protein
MRPRLAAVAVGVLLSVICLAADESNVMADPQTDFSRFKTFALRDAKIDVPKPELDNPLFVKKLGRAIIAALTAKRLTETTGSADLLLDFTITGKDFGHSIRPFRVGSRVPVRFTEGTLVIDLSTPNDQSPVWRGVYKDAEETGSKLVQRLPEDAKKLLSEYPPKKRQVISGGSWSSSTVRLIRTAR